MENAEIGPVAQLCNHLLLGPSLVADQTYNWVSRVLRELLGELKLCWISWRPRQLYNRVA